MSSAEPFPDIPPFIQLLGEMNPAIAVGAPMVEKLRIAYWDKLRALARQDLSRRAVMPGMIVQPDRMVVYLGDTHIAVEYFGPIAVPAELPDNAVQVTFIDCREADLVSAIVGFEFPGTGVKIPIKPRGVLTNQFVPVNVDTTIMMLDNGWDMTAEDMAFWSNASGVELPENDTARMINCFFYSLEEERLKTRRLQWVDFFSIKFEPVDEENSNVTVEMWPSFDVMVEFDSRIQYPKPVAFESERLSILNRFRELILSPGVTEPQITSWLSNPAHQFILRMAIPAVQLSSQRECAWQTEPNRPAIIPDFFATHANGFCDIVEFKLPTLKGETVVGTVNRERFSAEISSYIAQTRVYKEYFNEKANRDYVSQQHGINVYAPKRILVLGRRWEFEGDVWRAVTAEHPDLTLLTYDDLMDSVSAQLYQNPTS
jgi:hypothetical protein